MPDSHSRRSRAAGWAALLLGALAIGVAVVSSALFIRSLDGGSVRVGDGPQAVVLPAGRTYGVYVDDADNSGYSERCSILDARGRQVPLRTPGWTIIDSDTESLNHVFATGSGALTVTCEVPGEQVTLRPVPNFAGLLLGIALAPALGVAAVGFLVVRRLSGSRRRPATPAPSAPARP